MDDLAFSAVDGEPDDLHAINTQELLSYDANPTVTLTDLDIIAEILHPQERKPVCDFDPDHWNKFPSLDSVQTAYDFDIHIEPGEKINWMHSPKLDKVYIKLNSVMNLNISLMPFVDSSDTQLYVRAMIVFSSKDEIHLPVSRCPNHRIRLDPRTATLAQEVPDFHILKCCHPNTYYAGEENQQLFGARASLVVPLDRNARIDDNGRVSQSLGLEFLCQNSCSNGIQRRQTVLMFTLEDEHRRILGKRVMHFKVCSCPKRDMIKEHNSAPPSRKREASGPPAGKQPSKMQCVRPPPLQTIVKSEPATPSPPLSGSGDDGSPQPLPNLDQHVFVADAEAGMRGRHGLEPVDQQMVQLQLTVPRSSAHHVLRCAYGDVCAQMSYDKTNPNRLIQCAQQIKSQMDFYSADANSNIQ